MSVTAPLYYTPPDLEAAWEQWKCNCGPASLAALLGKPCAEVRDLFPGFAGRPYVNPTHMQQALTTAGIRYRSGKAWPERGLIFVQWGGPWLQPGVPIGAAYQRTHWIAVDGPSVFDINAGYWVTRDDWQEPTEGAAAYIMRHVPKCDGTWSIRTALEVTP